MMNPYDYRPQLDHATCVQEENNASCTRSSLRLLSSFSGSQLSACPVMAEYCWPKGRPRAPLAILLHGMGGRNSVRCRRIASTLANQGIASIILYMVFNVKRMPASLRDHYPKLTDQEWFEAYQLSVIDVRQILDWVQTRPELDPTRVAVIGYSFGSFISSIAMAIDKRIKAGILIESGGNSEKITRYSLLLRWTYKQSTPEYLRNQQTYASYRQEVAQRGFENVTPKRQAYLTDPLTFSSDLKDRPLIMISALFDEMIPRVSTLDLWRASGKPPLHWYPATHASLWMWYPWIGRKMAGFLAKTFLD